MPEDFLTLSELARESGVEIRTLRSWIAQGVIPGAQTVGRNARYAIATLARARAVRAMREVYGLTLPQIRKSLLTADTAEIEALAALADSSRQDAATPSVAGFRDIASEDTASSYDAGEPKSSPPGPGSSLARLVGALERAVGAKLSRRVAKAEPRLHILITPDIALAISGHHSREEIARFEQIADLLRAGISSGPHSE